MGKIINRTEEFYPHLEGAEYLEYEGEDVPHGVGIYKSNVVSNSKNELKISRFGSYWGWRSGGSFHKNFQSPEEAIANFQGKKGPADE